jgi:hypothetical protein
MELRWTHRQTHVFLQLREAMLNSEQEDTQYQTVILGVRREF